MLARFLTALSNTTEPFIEVDEEGTAIKLA
jgi:hypothetical protein